MKIVYCKMLILFIVAQFFFVNNNLYANLGDSSKVNRVSFGNTQVRNLFKAICDENSSYPNQFDDFIIYGFKQDNNDYLTVFFNDRWLLPYIKQSIENNLGYGVKMEGYMRYKKHNCLFYVLPDFFKKKNKRVKVPDYMYRMDKNADDYINNNRNRLSNDSISLHIGYRGITYRYANGKFIQQDYTLINGSFKYCDR